MTYYISAQVTVSIFTRVEASSEEEALELAADRPMQGFCHQCATGDEDIEWSLSEELDGTAEDLKVVR